MTSGDDFRREVVPEVVPEVVTDGEGSEKCERLRGGW